MPLPEPQSGETESDFIGRCMADAVMLEDFPDESQRMAVCQKQLEDNRMERRVMAFDTLKVETREQDRPPVIRGHAAVFDVLSENLGGFREKIAPGAFNGILKDDVRALFNHDPNLILGRTGAGTLRLSIDADGLVYELDPPDTTIGRDLVTSIQRGDINQSSFGFVVEDDDFSEDEEGRYIRTIRKIKRLFDVSPVTYPAYPDASVALRNLEHWKQDHEKPFDFDYYESAVRFVESS
jgi:HK97 family phage prohead protease